MIKEIIELGMKITTFFVDKLLNDHEHLSYIMRYVFDPEMSFYKNFGVVNINPTSIVSSFIILAMSWGRNS